ncbi:Cytochrome P450 [Naviculisporaceae sp. PSN 640]
MGSPTLLLAVFGAGVLSHIFYFHPGEHHLYVNQYTKTVVTAWLAGIAFCRAFFTVWHSLSSTTEAAGWLLAFVQWTELCIVYIAGVFLSLITWRIFFNPLNKFPGPFSVRISRLCRCWLLRKGKLHETLTELHGRYGNFVRLSPYDVSITLPEAVTIVQEAGTPCSKPSSYDLHKPKVSLQSMRDKIQHGQRRRVWSQGFGDKAVRGYEVRIRPYQDKLVNALRESDGKPMNVVKWSKFYGFDVMGDLAWGKSFGMLDRGKSHDVVDLLDLAAKPLSVLPPVWAWRILLAVPGIMKNWARWIRFVESNLEKRMQNTPEIPDIMETLLTSFRGDGKTPPSQDEYDLLVGDSQLIIVAGGDTVSTGIAAILYLLALNPEHIEKLREEIVPLTGHEKYPTSERLAASNHLTGVINEALRIFPPIPSQTIRQAPPEGITIGGEFIPGGTNIWVPQFAIGRDESLYPHADKFIPERWYDESRNLVKDKAAFAPFAIGQYGCIGKPLAIMSMRTTIARIVTMFDISFPKLSDSNVLINGNTTNELKPGREFEEGMLDHFIMGVDCLNLCFTPR